MEAEKERGYGNLPPWLRKVAGVRHRSGVSLHGGPERPACETVSVKLGWPWRPQDARDARATGYLLKNAANMEWDQDKRKKCVGLLQSAKLKELEISRTF